ncbi:MAG: ABC transporter permease [Propionibacteriaceae bacterium]
MANMKTMVARLFGYTYRSIKINFSNISFLVFTLALPLVIYLMMGSAYSSAPEASEIRRSMMISMSVYGGLGAAISSGGLIQSERSSGWFQQLMTTALRPQEFLIAKIITSVVVIIPALTLVYAAGYLSGVEISARQTVISIGLSLVGLIPMIILGLTVGLLFKAAAAQALNTLLVLTLSMLGGLWLPLEFFPNWVQRVGKCLPSYWIGELGRFPFAADSVEFPGAGVLVIAAWAGIFALVGVIAYRKAALKRD